MLCNKRCDFRVAKLEIANTILITSALYEVLIYICFNTQTKLAEPLAAAVFARLREKLDVRLLPVARLLALREFIKSLRFEVRLRGDKTVVATQNSDFFPRIRRRQTLSPLNIFSLKELGR